MVLDNMTPSTWLCFTSHEVPLHATYNYPRGSLELSVNRNGSIEEDFKYH